jgi:hypothetical protein
VRRILWGGLAGLLLAGTVSAGTAEPARITQEELVRRTQELFDAVSSGDQKPWQKYR